MAKLDGQRVVIKGVFGITGGILRQKYTIPETLEGVFPLSLVVFLDMTIVSAVSFYVLLIRHRASGNFVLIAIRIAARVTCHPLTARHVSVDATFGIAIPECGVDGNVQIVRFLNKLGDQLADILVS